MTRMPEAVFVVDINKEHIAVSESRKLGIRSFAIVDTNTNPTLIDYPIPANDDASKSIKCIVDIITKAISEGLAERSAKMEEKAKEKEKKAQEIVKNENTK